MLKRIYLNEGWKYSETVENPTFKTVDIPHTNKEIPFNYFDETIYQFVSLYRKEILIDKKQEGKHLFLTFEGVAHEAKVYVNNVLLIDHLGGYDAFKVDLKDKVEYGKVNVIDVVVDSRENLNIPPFGKVVDYLTYGGIYRDVYIDVQNEEYIKDVFVKTKAVNEDFLVDFEIDAPKDNKVEIEIKDQNNILVFKEECILRDLKTITILKPHVWDIDDPFLHKATVILFSGDKVVDTYETTFGFRSAIFKANGFFLNGRHVKIYGLNRHQSFPYIGYAVPESLQREDARILKQELGVNAVRTSHYMQSQYFIDECDKLGLLVFTESPGWQNLGDEEWKKKAVENCRQMVLQYRNHPSIILWGARINESVDCHDLYLETNKVIRELDPTRQTGGVRCYKKGEELEDVYTYNDFIAPSEPTALSSKKSVVTNMDMPYLVSECNGHMFPTKNYDDEPHRNEHMKRYARILDWYTADDQITALFGWCMFDYNTHKDFGSGDKICYHGVTDMFRNPKTPADLYHSMFIKDDNFLKVSSTLDHGEWPASNVPGFYVFTNADKIRFYRNGTLVREFTHKDSPYKNLPNAPIYVDDFVGDLLITNEGYSEKASSYMKQVLQASLKYGNKMPLKYMLMYLHLMIRYHVNYQVGYQLFGKYIGNWGDREVVYSFEAIKDDKVVNYLQLGESKVLHLETKVSSNVLHENTTYDMASIRLRVLNQNNIQAYYYNEPFELSVEGPIELVGPSIVSFKGGMSGTYIKTTHRLGKAKLIIKTPFETKVIEFEVK